jgi:orotidine-5'-phosphate decarboxylase
MAHGNPLCVALDTPDVAKAKALARALNPYAGCLKLGLEFFYANGAAGYEAVAAEGLPIFLDLKLHDIPNTVAQGLKSLMRLDPIPAIINVHAQGGPAMLAAAREAVGDKTKLIAVTVLTSLSDDDCRETGHDLGAEALALRLARLAHRAGLDGVVCSPNDLKALRAEFPKPFLAVTPGVRPDGADAHDQKRVATPKAALAAGADILVIGRAVTAADDPAAACREIRASLARTAGYSSVS